MERESEQIFASSLPIYVRRNDGLQLALEIGHNVGWLGITTIEVPENRGE